MKSTVKAMLFGITVSAISLGSFAADEGQGSWPTFRKADADNSGAISMDEARTVQGLGDNFGQHDKNSDGQLSRSEYESAKKAASKAGGAGSATGSAGEKSRY